MISTDQRFFLFAPPALDLPFRRYGVFYAFETLVKHQTDWPPTRGVAIKNASLMLGHAPFQAVPGRPNVIRAVGAMQYVEVSTHKKVTGSA